MMVTSQRKNDFLQGTLGLLVLKGLHVAEMHGYALRKWVGKVSLGALMIEEGSIYPTLLRLKRQGLIRSRRQLSASGRQVVTYSLTPSGRRHLRTSSASWMEFAAAVMRVLDFESPRQ